MKPLYLLFICSLCAILFVNCTTSHPIYSGESYESSNGVKEVSKPKFERKLNTIGYGMMGATAAVGAFAGYTLEPIKYNTKEATKNDPYLSAAAGGIIGLGVANLGNYIVAKKDQIYRIDGSKKHLDKWVRRYNNDYIPVYSHSNIYRITMIQKDIEPNYVFNNFDDITIFHSAFPNSSMINQVAEKSYMNFSHSSLPRFLEVSKVSNRDLIKDIKLYHINTSHTLSQYISALKLYPNIKEDPFIDGIEYIGSMVDVSKYQDYFTSYNERELIDKARKYAKTVDNVIYFNTTFPNNIYYDEVLKEISSQCDDSEYLRLIKKFPNTGATSVLKRDYVLNTYKAEEFISRNNRFGLYNMESSYAFRSERGSKHFIAHMNNLSNEIPAINRKKWIADASRIYLRHAYAQKDKSDYDQNTFISDIENLNYLDRSELQNYISKATYQLERNANQRYLVENELDDVDKYVYVKSIDLKLADGKDLSFWDQLVSVNLHVENHELYVIGQIKNTGSKPKKLKVNVVLPMVKKSKSLLGSSHNEYTLEEDTYVTIDPNSTGEILVKFDYKFKVKEEYSFWGENSFYQGVDTDNNDRKIDFNFSYTNHIPSSFADEVKEVRKNFKNSKSNTQNSSNYFVDSNTHTVEKQSKCSVEVNRLNDKGRSSGYVHIYTPRPDGYYFSEVRTRTGDTKKNSDASEDNLVGPFDSSEFPLFVTVQYKNSYGKDVEAVVRLDVFYDYEININ